MENGIVNKMIPTLQVRQTVVFGPMCSVQNSYIELYYKDLVTHKDIKTYINVEVKKKILYKVLQKNKEKYAKLCTNRRH